MGMGRRSTRRFRVCLISILCVAANLFEFAYADFMAIRKDGLDHQAVDLIYDDSLIDADEAKGLIRDGVDVAGLDPDPNDFWQNRSYSHNNLDSLSYPPEGAVVHFRSFMTAPKLLYRTRIQKEGDVADPNSVFQMMISLDSHSARLRSALLRRIGFPIPSPKRYREITVRFDDLETRQEFIDQFYVQMLIPLDENRWIVSQPEDEPLLVLRDIVLEPGQIDIPPYHWGLIGPKYIKGRRASRGIIIPLVLGEVGENLNLAPWEFGKAYGRDLILEHRYAGVFDESAWEDADWMARRIGKLKLADLEAIAAHMDLPEGPQFHATQMFIARRNDMVKRFRTGDRLYPVERHYTGDGVERGQVKQEFYPGYALRFVYNTPESPITKREIFKFFKIEAISEAIQYVLSQINEELVFKSVAEIASGRQMELQNDFESHIANFPDDPYQAPLGSWGGWFGGISVNANRSVVSGSFFGSDASRVQLADVLTLSANGGYFGSYDKFPRVAPSVSGAISGSRTFVHVRPVKSIEEADKESWWNLYVPGFMNGLAKVIANGKPKDKVVEGEEGAEGAGDGSEAGVGSDAAEAESSESGEERVSLSTVQPTLLAEEGQLPPSYLDHRDYLHFIQLENSIEWVYATESQAAHLAHRMRVLSGSGVRSLDGVFDDAIREIEESSSYRVRVGGMPEIFTDETGASSETEDETPAPTDETASSSEEEEAEEPRPEPTPEEMEMAWAEMFNEIGFTAGLDQVNANFTEFLDELEEGEQFILSDAFVLQGNGQLNLPLAALMGIDIDISNSISLAAGKQFLFTKRVTFLRVQDGIQVYIQELTIDSLSFTLDVVYYLNIFNVGNEEREGSAQSKVYMLDTDRPLPRDPDEKSEYLRARFRMAISVEAILAHHDTDLLQHYFEPWELDHELEGILYRGKALWRRWSGLEESHLLTVKPPPDSFARWDEDDQIRSLFSHRKLTRVGTNWEGLVSDIIEAEIPEVATFEDRTGGNPANSFFGSGKIRGTFAEAELTPGVAFRPMTTAENSWSGWVMSKERLEKVLDRLEERVVPLNLHKSKFDRKALFEPEKNSSEEADSEGSDPARAFGDGSPVNRNELANTEQIELYSIKSSLMVYKEGLDGMLGILFPPGGVDDLFKALVFLDDEDDFRKWCRRNAGMISYEERRTVPEKIREYEGQAYFNPRCIKPWMASFLQARGKSIPTGKKERVKYFARLLFYLEQCKRHDRLFLVFGPENYFFQIEVSGFRKGEEKGDLGYVSDAIGMQGPEGVGVFKELANDYKILQSEVFATFFNGEGF